MPPSNNNRVQVVRSKFSKSTTRQLLTTISNVDWSQKASEICDELTLNEENQKEVRYVWMVGANPSYFIQYQVDSYAIFKAYGKVALVWKPKYLEYPALAKLSDFGENPKTIKSLTIDTEQKNGKMSTDFSTKISQYLKLYYGMHYYNTNEQQFQKIKHYVSRISDQSYWHCLIDDHTAADVSSRSNSYLRLRIRGPRQKYDKDLIIFSQKGTREFLLRGKTMQILSFLAMLVIFVAVVVCPSGASEGYCAYRDEMMVGGAGLMMALMGVKVVNRGKYKKKLDRKIAELEKEE